MGRATYNWKRFWCPRGGAFHLSDDGYLIDPESEWGGSLQSEVVSLERVSNFPCLVLLGEPGIGKTTSLKENLELMKQYTVKTGDAVQWVDLKAYQTDSRLASVMFESCVFKAWRDGEHQLFLFLDSLDECLLRIDSVAAFLTEELRKYPIARLSLRIACRTADWPRGLEDGLKEIWGDNAVAVYELLPLRRTDVQEAARVNGVDPDTFLSEVEGRRVVPLAIKPVTLEFLLNQYRKDRKLPTRQIELYLDGCRLLCEETSQSRRDARQIGDFTAAQRLMVASRIAAATVFCNRFAVWTAVDVGNVPDEDITISELTGGTEKVDYQGFIVSEAAIRETLATGLFSSRGPDRLSWAHKTYAEFLAALYLVAKGVSPVQIISAHPGDPEGMLVPQLHEAAAWLGGMSPDVFCIIMNKEPEVLLRSDVATSDVQDRAILVENLMRRYDAGELLDRDPNLWQRYRNLAHHDLIAQLRPYIIDSSKGNIVRRAAIRIAHACDLKDLQKDLLEVALNASQPLEIRVRAPYSLSDLGDRGVRGQLRPLAEANAGDDPDDELKGCTLVALWPDCITAEEVFSLLTPPRRESLFGVYKHFLRDELPDKLTPEDLPTALQWATEHASGYPPAHPFEHLKDAIILQAWQHLETLEICEALAKAVLSRLRAEREIIGRFADAHTKHFMRGQEEKRRLLIDELLPYLEGNHEESLFWLVHGDTPLVVPNDVPWLVGRIRETQSEQIQSALARLLRIVLDWNNPEHVDAVISASWEISAIKTEFELLLTPVELGSPTADKMKAAYEEQQKWQQGRPERPRLEPPPERQIADLLDQSEAGTTGAFARITLEMTLEAGSDRYELSWAPDLTQLPGWKNADPATRSRIIEAAMRYVLDEDPDASSWMGTNTWPVRAVAGYKALRLILHEAPTVLSTLPAKLWLRWAATILTFPLRQTPSGR